MHTITQQLQMCSNNNLLNGKRMVNLAKDLPHESCHRHCKLSRTRKLKRTRRPRKLGRLGNFLINGAKPPLLRNNYPRARYVLIQGG